MKMTDVVIKKFSDVSKWKTNNERVSIKDIVYNKFNHQFEFQLDAKIMTLASIYQDDELTLTHHEYGTYKPTQTCSMKLEKFVVIVNPNEDYIEPVVEKHNEFDQDFREIKGFPRYYVKKDGTVYSAKRSGLHKLKTNFPKSHRTAFVNLVDEFDVRRTVIVGRAVAKAFLPNPNNYKYVTYLNGDNHDPRLENLAWIDNKRGKVSDGDIMQDNINDTVISESSSDDNIDVKIETVTSKVKKNNGDILAHILDPRNWSVPNMEYVIVTGITYSRERNRLIIIAMLNEPNITMAADGRISVLLSEYGCFRIGNWHVVNKGHLSIEFNLDISELNETINSINKINKQLNMSREVY